MQMYDVWKQARDLLSACEIDEPPVDLAKLARKRLIREIRVERSVVNGELRRLKSGGYIVRLDARDSEERRRFTLAHEIAHTFLLNDADVEDSGGCGNEDVEELCDFAAAELLIPDKLLRRSSLQVDIDTILSIAKTFRCSIEAAAWKLLNMRDFKGALLLWKVQRLDGVLTARVTAKPRTLSVTLPFSRGTTLTESDPNWPAIAFDGEPLIEIQPEHSQAKYLAERRRLRGSTIATLITLSKRRTQSSVEASSRQTSLFEKPGKNSD